MKLRTMAWMVGIETVLGVFGIASYNRLRPMHEATGGLASQRAALCLAIGVLVGVFILLVLRIPWHIPLAATLTALTGLELLEQGTRQYRFGEPRELYPRRRVVEYLQSLPKPFRVLGEGGMFFPNTNIVAGVEEIRTHDPVERHDYTRFLDWTMGYAQTAYFKHLDRRDAPVLDFLNVRYGVTSPGQPPPGDGWVLRKTFPEAIVYENLEALPRLFVPDHVTRILVPRAGLDRDDALRDFEGTRDAFAQLRDWRRAYVAVPAGSRELWPAGPPPEGVHVSRYSESANEARIAVRNPSGRRAVLVASLVQDGGWSATDERSHALPTARANGPFLAISVPEGTQRVQLRYRPPGSRLGSVISVGGCLAIAGYLLSRGLAG